MSRLSLRARLILGVIALAAAGLVAADVATYSKLSSFLTGRTDSALEQAHLAVERALGGPGEPRGGDQRPRGPGRDGVLASVPGDYVEIRRSDGGVVFSGVVGRFPGAATAPPPSLPKEVDLPSANGGGDRVRFFTVGALSGGERYRVRASIEPAMPGFVVLLAAPLHDVDATLHRLLLIELLVTGAVLLGIAILGLWVVRVGLRPLDAIGATAAAIAAGDLSRRVERADSRTEVGRLGIALNAMLADIEAAFRTREASEAKLRRFVADASHELRTPLSAVRAYAELFERGAAGRPDDLARSLRGITRESERMSLLVEDLLLLARLDEGRPLEQKPVALDDVVYEAVETARTLDPQRPLDVSVETASVIGDRDRLRQVVDNLLANVRAHTPAETPVRVSLARRNGSARLTVADSGPGLTAEQAGHVFERFYRTDSSRARASGGVGLGLSIVAAVAAAHGGTVSAQPEDGGGACFQVDLPVSDYAAELEPASALGAP